MCAMPGNGNRPAFSTRTVETLNGLVDSALSGDAPDSALLVALLEPDGIPLLPLLEAARVVREEFWGKEVRVQILNNLQNGRCTEDCNYCAQATSSEAGIQVYPMKSDEEILAGARATAESGATRYCMVLSGRAPTEERVRHLARLVREIKNRQAIEVCVSAGFLDRSSALILKEAGLDRYNHNVNTSAGFYGNICRSHEYADRIATLETARAVGLALCSGLIIGMGETPGDLVEVAATLRRLDVKSVPVNFYMHIPGSRLGEQGRLTPEYCLRALCLFRFMLPRAEIRAAGGRETNVRSLQPLCLYPANSLFCEGYLNSGGQGLQATLEMIRDAGFTVGQVES